jgi:hypothetical protein
MINLTKNNKKGQNLNNFVSNNKFNPNYINSEFENLDEELQNDNEIILKSIENDGDILHFANQFLLDDFYNDEDILEMLHEIKSI